MTFKQIKRFFILLIGGTITLIGVALIVLPGPAFIVIPLGLSILATEFVWAKKILDRVKEKIQQSKETFTKKK